MRTPRAEKQSSRAAPHRFRCAPAPHPDPLPRAAGKPDSLPGMLRVPGGAPRQVARDSGFGRPRPRRPHRGIANRDLGVFEQHGYAFLLHDGRTLGRTGTEGGQGRPPTGRRSVTGTSTCPRRSDRRRGAAPEAVRVPGVRVPCRRIHLTCWRQPWRLLPEAQVKL